MAVQGRLVEVATVPIGLSSGAGAKLRARALFKSRLLMAEVHYGNHGIDQNAEFPRWEDAFSIGVRLRSEVSETSVHGKKFDFRADAGCAHILYLSGVDYVDFSTGRHSIEMVLSRAFMREIAEDLELPAVTHLGNDACLLARDPVLARMATRIHPYFDDPATLDALYADSFMWSFGIYMMGRYGDLAARRPYPGGLTTWQERLAREMIEESLSDGITLGELAQACRVGVSQFAHGFKKSTGVAPYRWLIRRRVARSQNLLRNREMSLAAVAAACGFADQSHFTRTFYGQVGTTPGAWRAAI
ncbi:helix-turn-helix transcriptional regulator [Sphingomonas sp. OTU376]|uniref:helix-turn-helix transcriptional regulator n=1 Tax=Sphingomonas sp. OTU376 TaxID=3043863 RepID=UPI00313B682F